MPGLPRRRRSHRFLLLRYHRSGLDVHHPAPRNHTLLAQIIPEVVIRSFEFGFTNGDNVVAVAEFHEVPVRATAEGGETNEKRQS